MKMLFKCLLERKYGSQEVYVVAESYEEANTKAMQANKDLFNGHYTAVTNIQKIASSYQYDEKGLLVI
jgi:hypothetical protein